MGRELGWGFLALGALLLAACAAPAPDRTAAPAGPASESPAAVSVPTAAPAADATARLEPVRIGYASRSVSFLSMLLAQGQGFYREQGLDAELIQTRPNVAMTALLSGEIDYTETLGSNVRAAVQGAPVKTVLVSMLAPAFALVARPEYPTVAQLRGRIVGITSLGGTNEQVTRLLFQQHGLEPQRDVQLIAVGDSPVQYEALRLGQIDATVVAMPYPVLARQEGFPTLLNAADAVQIPQTGIGVLQARLDARREQVRRVAKAEIQALRYIRAQPQEVSRLIADLFEVDPAIGEQVYAAMAPVYSPDGTVPRASIELVMELAREAGEAAATLPFEQVADASLVPEALRELAAGR